MLSFLFFEVKGHQYFVSSSYTFLYKKTLLKTWLNPGLDVIKDVNIVHRGVR